VWVSRSFGSNFDADATLMGDAKDTESGNEKTQKNEKKRNSITSSGSDYINKPFCSV
jgi:hypothetical protein